MSYTAVCFKDGVNANKQAEDYHGNHPGLIRTLPVDFASGIGGGFPMKLELCPVHGPGYRGIPRRRKIFLLSIKYIETEVCMSPLT